MSWIIAVLLGLILVAMVSSNKDASDGVWKVIRFAIVSIALLIVWGALIGFSLWYSANYFKGEWEKILYISMFVFLPPVYLWISRKRLVENFKRDKKAAYRKCAIFISVGAAFLLVGVIIGEVRATYENGGWFMVLTPLALTSIVLLWRTLRTPRKWREVWCGLPPLPDLYEVLDKERYEESLIDEAEWKKIEATWDEQTSERQYELMYEREERWRNFEKRMDGLAKELLANKASRLKDEKWTVFGFFWLFLMFATFGLIGIVWDFSMAYALQLKFVQEKTWLAGVVIIGAGLVAIGLIVSIFEYISELKVLKR